MTKLLLVDTGNLYYCVNKRFPKRRIDYARYIEQAGVGDEDRKIAYVSESNSDTEGFKAYLTELGFEVKAKRPTRNKVKGQYVYQTNWCVEMSLDTVMSDATDVIIGTADPGILPLLERLSGQLTVFASGVPRTFKTHARIMEIEEDVLCS